MKPLTDNQVLFAKFYLLMCMAQIDQSPCSKAGSALSSSVHMGKFVHTSK